MEQYWEWFCSIPGIYRTQREILLRCFHDPRQLYEASEKELIYLHDKGCRWIQKVISYRKEFTPEKTVYQRKKLGIGFTYFEQENYPRRLLPLRDRPYGLFWRGSLPREDVKSVAIVGSRMCTPAGKGMAENIAREVAIAGGIVVSGGAYGIDGASGLAAVEEGGSSFAVFGCGVDQYYPSSNRRLFELLIEKGGLISEFPAGIKAMPSHFPMRNRIISGLSDAVVVVEARKQSGSLITADFALDQGRMVYAVPGRPDDDLSWGCNELISQGAGVILSAESFAETIFQDYKKNKKKNLSENIILEPTEKLVYSIFGLQAKSLWELEEDTAVPLGDLCDCLVSLELKGFIRETEKNYFIKVK